MMRARGNDPVDNEHGTNQTENKNNHHQQPAAQAAELPHHSDFLGGGAVRSSVAPHRYEDSCAVSMLELAPFFFDWTQSPSLCEKLERRTRSYTQFMRGVPIIRKKILPRAADRNAVSLARFFAENLYISHDLRAVVAQAKSAGRQRDPQSYSAVM
jgi:hypothetical protein